MAGHQPPHKPSTWEAAIRHLSENPDSPASLRLLSAFNRSVQPQQKAMEQLVEALSLQLEDPDAPAAQARVDASIAHWERVCGGPLDSETMALLEEDARKALEDSRRKPPSLESILVTLPDITDYGYQLGLDLGGLRGTWHRLWAALVLDGTLEPAEDLINALRADFEEKLGRALTQPEWSALKAHADRRVAFLGRRPVGKAN